MIVRLRQMLREWLNDKAKEEKRELHRQKIRDDIQPLVQQLDEDENRRQAVMREVRIIRRSLHKVVKEVTQ